MTGEMLSEAGPSTGESARKEMPLLDEDTLDELLEGLDPDDILEVAEMSFAEIDTLIDELHAALSSGDEPAIRPIAHKIKGCASSIGAGQVAHIAAALELSGAIDEAASAHADSLKALFPQTRQALFAAVQAAGSAGA